MTRILLVLHPEKINITAIDFGCYLSKSQKATLHILFLGKDSAKGNPTPVAAEALNKVYDTCIKREAAYHVMQHTVATDELLLQALFSDLLILDPALSLNNRPEAYPTALVRFILQHASCPVVVSPEQFDCIDEIIFTNDDGMASAFAMKQFTYLFPDLNSAPVTLLEILGPGKHSRYNSPLAEWLQQHYKQISHVTLRGKATEQLMLFLLSRRNSIVIMGAFGGGTIRHLVHQSTAQPAAQYTTSSFFIAHR